MFTINLDCKPNYQNIIKYLESILDVHQKIVLPLRFIGNKTKNTFIDQIKIIIVGFQLLDIYQSHHLIQQDILVMNGTKVRLGYWGIRGRGQVPRLLLAYTQAVWEDVQYTSPEQWFGGDKQSLGLNFPNLPYLIEGDLKITETEAICHYIIDRSNKKELLGKSPQHKAVVMNIIGVLNECFDNVVKILYVPDGLKTKQAIYKEKFLPKLEYLSKFMGNNNWLLGYLTYADFLLVELSYYLEHIYPELYPQLKFLAKLRENFYDQKQPHKSLLPEIQKYYEQATSIKGPFTSLNYSNLKF